MKLILTILNKLEKEWIMLNLYNGDYLELIDNVQDELVDLILTDIPYNISRPNGFAGYDKKNKRTRTGIDFGEWDTEFDISGLKALTAKLKKNGSILIFSSFEQLGTIIETFDDLIIKDKLIWQKTNPFVRNRDRRYISNIEICSWFVKPKSKWTFNRQDEKYESCVMKYPAESGGGFKRYHPTQKNLKMTKYLINIHSNVGDLILDPFMGGGTTGVAALQENRNFIGMELEKNYFDIAKERIRLVPLDTLS